MTTMKHYWRRAVLVLAAVALAVGSMTACGADDSDCQGDPGKVTAKVYDHDKNGDSEYELTVQRADGSTYEKDVSPKAYGWYKRGSTFPHPTKCNSGKLAED